MIYCSTGSDEALTLKCLAVHCNIVRVSSCRLDYSDESDDSGPIVPTLLKIPPFLVLFVAMLASAFGIPIH